VDVAIEARHPTTFDICQNAMSWRPHRQHRVHGKSVELHLEKTLDRNIPSHRPVSTNTIPCCVRPCNGALKPAQLIPTASRSRNHRSLSVFGNAAKEKAMKVILYAV